MKKLFSVVACVAVMGWAGSTMAAPYAFEDMIDDWTINGNTYGSVYIDQQGSILPNSVSNLNYTHDINQEVNLAAGDTVLEAWLELDFTDMDLLEDGDDFGSMIFGLIKWDQREFVQYTYDAAASAWIEIDTSNDVQTVGLSVDWLNSDGLLDVSINVWNPLGTGDIALDHSRLYGTANAVPEPTTMLLFGTGIAGLAAARRRKANK